MAERLVRVGHLVGVFALLHRGAAAVHRVGKLAGKALFHGVFVALFRSVDQPADRQRLAADRADFYRNLIGGTTDAAGTHLDRGLHVVHGLVEDLDRLALEPGLHAVQRIVDDALGRGFLAVNHQVVHEFGQHAIAIFGVGQDFALFSGVTTGHLSKPSLRTLGAVFRAALTTIFDALRIQDTAKDVVAHTGKVFHPAAADQHDAVFLQVVLFTGNIADDLETIGQAH